MNNTVIYHGNCDDGFGAAWVLNNHLQGQIQFYADMHQEPPPWGLIDDQNIWIVDFAYPRTVMEEIIERARYVIWIDHHDTAIRESGDLRANHLTSVLDRNLSGSMLTWYFCHPNTVPPQMLEYIQDRDLWKNELPFIDEVTIARRSYPMSFNIWDEFMTYPGMDVLFAEGKSLWRYFQQVMESFLERLHPVQLKGIEGLGANVPYPFQSDFANLVSRRFTIPFGAAYWELASGDWQFSLSSSGDFHVGELAHRYGGGGHAGCAGFKVPDLACLTESSQLGLFTS